MSGTIDIKDLQYLQVDKSLISDSANLSEWSSKKLVWIADETEGFISASLIEEKDNEVTVKLSNNKIVKLAPENVQKMNPPKFFKSEDMADLTYLNEASVLYNLKDRYFSDLIYVNLFMIFSVIYLLIDIFWFVLRCC